MTKSQFNSRQVLPAVFAIMSAAVFGVAQQPSENKHNTRPEAPIASPASSKDNHKSSARFTYEFTKPEFLVRHIVIEHDASGRGTISFSKLHEETPVVEPIQFSAAVAARVSAHWDALNFLESEENYQSERQFPHLGTMRLKMEQDLRKRTAEFNYTKQPDALALITEYRRAAEQAILVFDISVARESQPLNAPKLMEQFESLLKRGGLSDPKQLLPLLKEITIDEHLPLIARNHAARLIKKIEK